MKTEGEPTNLQRALWVFLGYMLLGPFFAGLAVTALLILVPFFNLSYFLPAALPPLGVAVVTTFVWAAIPAAISAIIVVAVLLKIGNVSWIAAAVAGVVGFGIASVVTQFAYPQHLAALAMLAGVLSMAVREALESGNIIN